MESGLGFNDGFLLYKYKNWFQYGSANHEFKKKKFKLEFYVYCVFNRYTRDQVFVETELELYRYTWPYQTYAMAIVAIGTGLRSNLIT